MRSINLAYFLDIEDPNLWTQCEKQHSFRAERITHTKEIDSLKRFVKELLKNGFTVNDCDNFFYSFAIPQISKEFDLLRISEEYIINIELKSDVVSEDKIIKQLQQNRYYLESVNTDIFSFTYISSNNKLYFLTSEKELIESSFNHVCCLLKHQKNCITNDIESLFTVSNYLISPLNSPERFINEQYFLSNNQSDIKRKILGYCYSTKSYEVLGITGGPGTGKSLLLYDIARELSYSNRCCVIHCGILCNGHEVLNNLLKNIDIISVRDISLIDYSKYKYILVDESHRIYSSNFDELVSKAKEYNIIFVFAYDKSQMLSKNERKRAMTTKIENTLTKDKEVLTNKIRTNPELLSFIMRVMNLKYVKDHNRKERLIDTVQNILDNKEDGSSNRKLAIDITNQLESKLLNSFNLYPSVSVVYANSRDFGNSLLDSFCRKGYQYISYSSSNYNQELDLYKTYNSVLFPSTDTHHVIGQEFEKVVMIIDNNFMYFDYMLRSSEHPNPDYLYPQLLFQGMTRVREKLALIVVGNKAVFKCIMDILQND